MTFLTLNSGLIVRALFPNQQKFSPGNVDRPTSTSKESSLNISNDQENWLESQNGKQQDGWEFALLYSFQECNNTPMSNVLFLKGERQWFSFSCSDFEGGTSHHDDHREVWVSTAVPVPLLSIFPPCPHHHPPLKHTNWILLIFSNWYFLIKHFAKCQCNNRVKFVSDKQNHTEQHGNQWKCTSSSLVLNVLLKIQHEHSLVC